MQTRSRTHSHLQVQANAQTHTCTHWSKSQIRETELWVTDLAKVAYGAQPNHTRQIQFNKLSVRRERDRDRESLHFTEKAFVSSEYFTETHESEFLSLQRLRMKKKWLKERKKQRRGRKGECCPLLSSTVYFSSVSWNRITPICLNTKTKNNPFKYSDPCTHVLIYSSTHSYSGLYITLSPIRLLIHSFALSLLLIQVTRSEFANWWFNPRIHLLFTHLVIHLFFQSFAPQPLTPLLVHHVFHFNFLWDQQTNWPHPRKPKPVVICRLSKPPEAALIKTSTVFLLLTPT